MKSIKRLIIILIAGLVIGFWFGLNVGKGNALLSNPFSEPDLQKTIRKTSGEVLEMSGKIVEEQGKALQDKVEN